MATVNFFIFRYQNSETGNDWGTYMDDGTWARSTTGSVALYSTEADALTTITSFSTSNNVRYNIRNYYTSA